MDKNDSAKIETLQEEPINIPEKPINQITPSHPFPKYIPKKIALILIIILISIFLIGGTYEFIKLKNDQTLVSLSPTPSISQDQTSNSESTEGWKTYSNDDLGFSFKYPAESELTFNCIDCKANAIMISFPNDTYTLISANSSKKYDKSRPTVKDILDSRIYVSKFSTSPVSITRSPYVLDGIEGEKIFSEQKIGDFIRNDIEVLVIKDEKLYTFDFRFKPENKQTMIEISDRILSSFKFTN